MGLDHERLVGKQASEDSIREAIMRCIADEPRVQSVEEVAVEWDAHSRAVQAHVWMTSADGEEVELVYADRSGIEA